jgi:hypothetical protein
MRLFHHGGEVADRLVGVHAEQQGDRLGHEILDAFQLARRMAPPPSGMPPPLEIGTASWGGSGSCSRR